MKQPGTDLWIGVLGGGQLGRMLALEARRMGIRVLQWTGGDHSGAAGLADEVLTEAFDSEDALARFIERADVATVEFENIPVELLRKVGAQIPLMPSPEAVMVCQHREREKRFFAEHQIPCVKFCVVDDVESLKLAVAEISGPMILKAAEFGYDGKGQMGLKGDEDMEQVWVGFGVGRAVVEERIDLAQEFSMMIARGADGALVTYDAAENYHRNHILDVSIVPGRVPAELLDEARAIAVRIVEALEYVGILGVEFFVSGDGRLLVNELAPRPHNSGHHTLDACETSQFEQQIRVICSLPLGSPALMRPVVMWNLMGELWESGDEPPDWTPIFSTPGAKLHLYGKSPAKKGRKMGHATFTAATLEGAIARANHCRRELIGDTVALIE